MLVGVRAPGPGGTEEPPFGGGESLPPKIPTCMEWRESQRCCLEITGDKTIVPRREAERKPQAGPERQEGHLGVSKTRNNGGPGNWRRREGYRKRCSWLSLTAAVRSHFVK